MSNVIDFPGERPPGGSGPEGPMIEDRVRILELKVDRIDQSLQRIESKISDLSSNVAKIDGRMQNMPTTIQWFGFIITTWSAGAAIVLAIIRFSP